MWIGGANPAVFIGGGALLLKDAIVKSSLVMQAEFEEDPRANAIGYKLLGERQLRKLVNQEHLHAFRPPSGGMKGGMNGENS